MLAVLMAGLHAWRGLDVDDGFIVLRYARNLLDGDGLVFNPGERVEGYSSPLWMFFLVVLEGAARLFGAPSPERLELVNRGLGIVCAAGAVIGTFSLARFRFGLPPGHSLGSAALVLFSWPMIFWSGAGLETSLVALCIVLVAARLIGPDPFARGRAVGTTVLLLALAVSRPEGPLYVMFAGLACIGSAAAAAERARAGGVFGATAVLYGVLVLARFGYYGELLPNTYYAKVGGGASAVLRGVVYWVDYVTRGGGGGLVLLSGVGVVFGARQPEIRRHLPALGLLGAGVVFVLVAGGDGLYCFRFVAHVVPLLAAYAALGAHALERHGSSSAWGRWVGRGALSVAWGLSFWPAATDESLLYGDRNRSLRESERDWSELGRLLRASFPADALLATNVAGKVPYRSELPTLDLLGLTDAVVARTPVASMGRGYAGHEKANPEYVLARRPAVIFLSVLERMPFETFRRLDLTREVLAKSPLGGYAPLLAGREIVADYLPGRVIRSRAGGVPIPVFVRRDLVEQLHSSRVRISEWRTSSR